MRTKAGRLLHEENALLLHLCRGKLFATEEEGNLGGRNPGQKTVFGDRDASRSRGEDATDPMTSRDSAIRKNADSK